MSSNKSEDQILNEIYNAYNTSHIGYNNLLKMIPNKLKDPNVQKELINKAVDHVKSGKNTAFSLFQALITTGINFDVNLKIDEFTLIEHVFLLSQSAHSEEYKLLLTFLDSKGAKFNATELFAKLILKLAEIKTEPTIAEIEQQKQTLIDYIISDQLKNLPNYSKMSNDERSKAREKLTKNFKITEEQEKTLNSDLEYWINYQKKNILNWDQFSNIPYALSKLSEKSTSDDLNNLNLSSHNKNEYQKFTNFIQQYKEITPEMIKKFANHIDTYFETELKRMKGKIASEITSNQDEWNSIKRIALVGCILSVAAGATPLLFPTFAAAAIASAGLTVTVPVVALVVTLIGGAVTAAYTGYQYFQNQKSYQELVSKQKNLEDLPQQKMIVTTDLCKAMMEITEQKFKENKQNSVDLGAVIDEVIKNTTSKGVGLSK